MTDAPRRMAEDARCPCLSGDSYGECCAPFHRGDAWPPSAERLMRSRYSAFAVGDPDYLLASWHPDTRPEAFELEAGLRWYRLDIVARTAGGLLDTTGTVDFRAYWRAADGTAGVQSENSRFVRADHRWVYLGEA
ncbi:YchJ family protein [Glaciihabitans sp. INWT7]|uniref:YchJ family protein n=1 Tax=Glaciihabitans sp. INWT7 TaxID=2596912 RepID=UPI00351C8FC3